MEANTVAAGCEPAAVDTNNTDQNQTDRPYVGGTIPAELRAQPRWVVARMPSKVPLCAFDSTRNASSTDPSTWADFDTAAQAVERDPNLQLGFMLGGGFVGIDLDRCRNADTGAVEPWAEAIVARLASYTEISISGTGIHVICRGTLPVKGRRKGRLEMYAAERYFVMTGDGFGVAVAERTPELTAVFTETFDADAPEITAPPASGGQHDGVTNLTDDQLLAKIQASAQGGKFRQLWDGDTKDYPSHSEADEALCGMLAWWTQGDIARIDRLFRLSKLYRDKWDRDGYRERTIRQAIAGAGVGYQPTNSAGAAPPVAKHAKRFTFHTHRELLARPAARFLVKDVIVDGSFIQLVAKPGTYKTFLALDLALSVASGQPSWLGYRINRHGPVVYIGSEGVGRLKYRVQAWMAHHGRSGDIPNFRWLDDAVALLDAGDSYEFVRQVADVQPVLVIFDTLSRTTMAGADENSQKDMSKVVRAIDALRQTTGCTVMVIHHLNAAGTRERGSTVLTGAVDTTFRLDQPTKGYVTMTCRKQKDAAEMPPVALKPRVVTLAERDPDSGEPVESVVLVKADEFEKLKAQRAGDDKIIRMWLAHPEMSRHALARAVGGRRLSVILDAIDRLDREGSIQIDKTKRSGRKRHSDNTTIH
jgi:putative DNA primase/helicase